MATAEDLIRIATSHLGEDGPENSCVSNGAARWLREAGIDYPSISYSAADVAQALGTNYGGPKTTDAYVTALATLAKRGEHGFTWVDADQAQLGDLLIWPDYDHVSVYVELTGGNYRSIGSGTPNGKVSTQPAASGGNPASYFIGAVRPPYVAAPAQPAPAPAPEPEPAPAPPPARTHTVVSGDTLWDIAGDELGDHTRWPEIYELNKGTIGGNPDLILPGQVLTLP